MRERAAMINEEIARVVRELGMDWRTSWSKVWTDPGGGLRVAVSRREVLESLSLPEGIEVELAGLKSDKALWATASVVDVRREPEHSSELLTQAVMGETMVLLDSRGDWYLVMLDDGYHGWVRSWSVGEYPRERVEAYRRDSDAMVGSSVAYVLTGPDPGSLPVSDITAGSRVVTRGETCGYAEVELPGGRYGYIEAASLEPLPSGRAAGADVISRAMRFLGIPYVWGGTSAKGFDCSGLVKRVMSMEGIETPRDADQQSGAGGPVDAPPGAIPEGALLFFGEGGRITHVAISLGGWRFIHSYGDVRVNSLLASDSDWEEKLSGIYLFSKDLLG